MKAAYAVVPHYILGSDLTGDEKVMCAIIDGFCKSYGDCRVSYEVIAKMLGKYNPDGIPNTVPVRKTISRLYRKGVVKNIGTLQNRNLRLTIEATAEPDHIHPAEEEEKEETKPSASENDQNSQKDIKTQNFEKFWSLYPRKEGKAATRKKFMKLSVRKQERILSIMPEFLAKMHDVPQQYIKLPATFLNQEVYEDFEPPATVKTGANEGAAGKSASEPPGQEPEMWKIAWAIGVDAMKHPEKYKDRSPRQIIEGLGYGSDMADTFEFVLGDDLEFLLDNMDDLSDASLVKSMFYGLEVGFSG